MCSRVFNSPLEPRYNETAFACTELGNRTVPIGYLDESTVSSPQTTGEASTLRFVEWEKPEDFQSRLVDILAEELKLADTEDQRGFN